MDLSASYMEPGGYQNAGPGGTEGIDQSFVDGKKIETTRICEYCEVKLDNPQLDKFYEVGRTWRRREMDILEQKLEFYRDSVGELEHEIAKERESCQNIVVLHKEK